jgi:glycolate oxidase iron-sulfur subunit
MDYSVLQQCMHCGLCLPTCPTYLETGRERNSPRGRISLMRAIADGELDTTKGFADEMSYCLGCLACATACPAGVDYATLFETARAEVERSGVRLEPPALVHPLVLPALSPLQALRPSHRGAFLVALRGERNPEAAAQVGAPRAPSEEARELERQTIPMRSKFSDEIIAAVEKPRGEIRHRVAVLTGCIQDIAFSDVNRATVDVLLENGCEVTTPRSQSCCGSLHVHNGDLDDGALQLARRQIDSIDPSRFDAIISNSAGCGSHLKRYGHLLAGDPAYTGRAAAWSAKVRDISEWLVEIGFRAPAQPARGANAVAVTYHEACHLCHGQKISSQPREILRAIPGVELRECPEATMCCGSAGVYSLTQPTTAAWLRDRKVGHIRSTGASIVATANPGCQLQIQQGVSNRDEDSGTSLRVVHPIVLLAEAYRAGSPL